MNKIDHLQTRLKTLQSGYIASCLRTALLLVTLSGCSSTVIRLNQQAQSYGFEPISSNADGFVLQSFFHPVSGPEKRLHVYLEGDGTPWEHGLVPAAEPTTRDSVMLPLMAMDSAPSLYLGRPCYNGHANDAYCSAALWTDARYGERVIAAMTRALNDFISSQNYRELVLIGHSGGGALALLMAERLPQTVAVVTLAGNFDIDLWADYHGYPRLNGSLNPAAHPGRGIPEWHLLGLRDQQIPPQLFQEGLQHRPNSRVEIVDADHHHSWQAIWPLLLQRLEQHH